MFQWPRSFLGFKSVHSERTPHSHVQQHMLERSGNETNFHRSSLLYTSHRRTSWCKATTCIPAVLNRLSMGNTCARWTCRGSGRRGGHPWSIKWRNEKDHQHQNPKCHFSNVNFWRPGTRYEQEMENIHILYSPHFPRCAYSQARWGCGLLSWRKNKNLTRFMTCNTANSHTSQSTLQREHFNGSKVSIIWGISQYQQQPKIDVHEQCS